MQVSQWNVPSVALTEEHVYFGGMNLKYQLLLCAGELWNRFFIRVTRDGECCMADAGVDLTRAVAWYQDVVRGSTTPCALSEVMRILREE